jgi:1-acyl-sn-glycerol-3-phosphate acyltransferase/nucleoside-diphosphate-sugar epimerase
MTRVLLLGGPGGLSRALARRLGESEAIAECRSLDVRQQPLPAADLAAGCQVAVYLAAAAGRRGWPPGAPQVEATLKAVAASGVEAIVVVSSAAVFPPRNPHPGMVDESRPPLRAANAAADAWAALEQAARRAVEATPSIRLTILRPAAVPTPDGDDYLSRVLRSRLAATFVGHDPCIQLLSADDLAAALALAVQARQPGLFHVAPAGVVPVHKALAFARTRRVPLPAWLQRLGRWALRGLGVAPWADAERIRYSSTVSGRKIEEGLGFRPRHSSAAVAASFGGRSLSQGEAGLPEFDPYGQDKSYIAWLHRTVIGFLHNVWWRVEVAGTEHIPREGPAVLAGVHRGFMPFDGTMILYDVVKHTGRHPRFLIHPNLVKEVFLSPFMERQGGVQACRPNADWVLQRGDLLGYFPEGVEGAFSYYWEAHRLREDFGRDEFVKTALRHRVPIIPFVSVGNVEIFPVIAKFDWGWWKRLTGWPCFPIAPPFPLLPVPLPTKWHTRVLAPLPVHEQYGPEAAADEQVVAKISAEVRTRLQAALDEMRARRRFILFGSIFDREAPAVRNGKDVS